MFAFADINAGSNEVKGSIFIITNDGDIDVSPDYFFPSL